MKCFCFILLFLGNVFARGIENNSAVYPSSSKNLLLPREYETKQMDCRSFDEVRQIAVLGRCPYISYQQRDLNASLPPEDMNEVLCGPLHREGLFCSKCKHGYGIPVFSKVTDECVKCGSKFAWPLYLALVLIPITLFYILVIIFNFSATHPPITAYIFYCQLFTLYFYNVRYLRDFTEINTNKVLLYFTMTVCDIWNLDFFRYVVPGYCLSEHFTNTDVMFLELITAFYPILLVIVTLIFIDMHARNVRIVTFLWRPFHKCFSKLRRKWDPKSSVINAFATFLLLSSFKICFLCSNFLYKATSMEAK